MAARSKQAIIATAAALVLFSALGAFFHQHSLVPPIPAVSCSAAIPDARFEQSRLTAEQDRDGTGCAICFFNRCASHGASFLALAQQADFAATPIVLLPDVHSDAPPARLREARGPPAA